MKRIFVDIEKCMACKTCEIVCAVKHSKSCNLFGAIKEKPNPSSRIKVIEAKVIPIPLQCRHCVEPLCEQACISGAIKIEEEFVSVDKEKCVHCYSCVMACPYGVIDIQKEENIAIKCDLCLDEEIPPCVKSCPTKSLFYGELKDFKKQREKREEKCTM